MKNTNPHSHPPRNGMTDESYRTIDAAIDREIRAARAAHAERLEERRRIEREREIRAARAAHAERLEERRRREKELDDRLGRS